MTSSITRAQALTFIAGLFVGSYLLSRYAFADMSDILVSSIVILVIGYTGLSPAIIYGLRLYRQQQNEMKEYFKPQFAIPTDSAKLRRLLLLMAVSTLGMFSQIIGLLYILKTTYFIAPAIAIVIGGWVTYRYSWLIFTRLISTQE